MTRAKLDARRAVVAGGPNSSVDTLGLGGVFDATRFRFGGVTCIVRLRWGGVRFAGEGNCAAEKPRFGGVLSCSMIPSQRTGTSKKKNRWG